MCGVHYSREAAAVSNRLQAARGLMSGHRDNLGTAHLNAIRSRQADRARRPALAWLALLAVLALESNNR